MSWRSDTPFGKGGEEEKPDEKDKRRHEGSNEEYLRKRALDSVKRRKLDHKSENNSSTKTKDGIGSNVVNALGDVFRSRSNKKGADTIIDAPFGKHKFGSSSPSESSGVRFDRHLDRDKRENGSYDSQRKHSSSESSRSRHRTSESRHNQSRRMSGNRSRIPPPSSRFEKSGHGRSKMDIESRRERDRDKGKDGRVNESKLLKSKLENKPSSEGDGQDVMKTLKKEDEHVDTESDGIDSNPMKDPSKEKELNAKSEVESGSKKEDGELSDGEKAKNVQMVDEAEEIDSKMKDNDEDEKLTEMVDELIRDIISEPEDSEDSFEEADNSEPKSPHKDADKTAISPIEEQGAESEQEKVISEEKILSPRSREKSSGKRRVDKWGSVGSDDESTDVSEIQGNDSFMDMDEDGELPVSLRWLHGCRNADEHYEKLNCIDEGTYGVVYRAKNKETGEIVALKRVKLWDKLVKHEGFPLTALREINILLQLNHENIVGVKEVVMLDQETIMMVMEYCDHDIKSIHDVMKRPFSTAEVKCLLIQLLKGVEYMHKNWIFHRDIKPSNLLLTQQGILKICDMGLSRNYGSPLRPYTPYDKVVTLWYRAPELLLGIDKYSTSIDMWSVGCIFAELLLKEPLFPGEKELDQFNRIAALLGAPKTKNMACLSSLPNPMKFPFKNLPSKGSLREKFPKMCFRGGVTLSDSGFNLLEQMLCYDPEKRISATEALNHVYFQELPIACDASHMPTLASTHDVSRKHRPKKRTPASQMMLKVLENDMARYERVRKNRDRHY